MILILIILFILIICIYCILFRTISLEYSTKSWIESHNNHLSQLNNRLMLNEKRVSNFIGKQTPVSEPPPSPQNTEKPQQIKQAKTILPLEHNVVDNANSDNDSSFHTASWFILLPQ